MALGEKGQKEKQRSLWMSVRSEAVQGANDGDGQGGLACCSSWGCKESDTTEQLN